MIFLNISPAFSLNLTVASVPRTPIASRLQATKRDSRCLIFEVETAFNNGMKLLAIKRLSIAVDALEYGFST